MFGKSPFGSSNTSAFGSSSLFGSASNRTTTGFGAQTTTQNTGLFGQKSIFGSSGQSTSLFGSTQSPTATTTSIFGQSKPLFGSSATTQSTGFGTTTSLFGSTPSSQQTGGIFGSGFGSSTVTGTTIKFEPPTSTDTMLRNGTNQAISTKHMCITAMKQYESKSLEELRCEDYLANRKGPQSGALSFGQTSQSSTTLFGSSATTTQTSIFGQNKPLFGTTSTGFGATNTTTSSLFGTPATSTSFFGSKPTTGGLFGTSTTASPFGQTQTNTGLFGSKPSTGFGTQTTSLFGGSTFNTSTTTASPFSFGSSTATTSTPFGQKQPAFSSFSGFQQPSASAASTGLFGSKPTTSGFGAFGTSTSTASPFGTQQTSGLFGSKPSTGGLFSSNTGGFFGQTATSSAPSLFGSTTTKPGSSLFSSTTTQPAFGSANQLNAGSSVVTATPIVLGANVSQSLIENALIEAQLAASPYGDNPLLKLLTTKAQEKSDMPNPVSVERQMRFLASRKEASAVTTTTPSGPLTLGSIPAAGLRISSSASKTQDTIGDFSYRSMFSPPALRSSTKNTSLDFDNTTDRSFNTSNSVASKDASGFLEFNNSQSVKSKRNHNIKRLDLSVLHKSVHESRRSSVASSTAAPSAVTRTDKNCESIECSQEGSTSNTDQSCFEKTPTARRTNVSFQVSSESDSTDSATAMNSRSTSASPRGILRRRAEVPLLAVCSEEGDSDGSQNVTNGCISSVSSDDVTEHEPHPAGIILTRKDYECEPSLGELAQMALQNDGVCHIESGFTVRRLAFGSVFWPGPIDLHDVDLDKVVHFRQHEVIVYPDDNSKPPIGEQLNRFAEVSLDRVWPRDKKTKEFITDPIRLEEMGYRAKLERASLKMGAKFKDYRPDTGTWVFTVPHFTKYGLIDGDDDADDMVDEMQQKIALNDSKIQDAVQRAKLPQIKITEQVNTSDLEGSTYGFLPNGFHDSLQELKQIESLHDSTFFVRGLGGKYGCESSFPEQDAFFVKDIALPSAVSENEHKMDLCDSKVVLENLVADSLMIDGRRKEDKGYQLETHLVSPLFEVEHFIREGEQVVGKMATMTGVSIDSFLMKKSARIGWNRGRICLMSDFSNSFVQKTQLQCFDQVPAKYISDLFEKIDNLSKISVSDGEGLTFQNVPQRIPEGDFLNLINCLLCAAKSYNISHDSDVWELCDALFGSHITATTDYTKVLNRRENVSKWLQKFMKNPKRNKKLPSSGPAKILHFMLNGDLEAAVEEAIDSNYPHLAFALSTFKYTDRAAYKNQIIHWKKTKECKFIDMDLLKIYLLMAGEMKAEINGKEVFVNDGLDGLKALGTFLWYYEPFDASLKNVLLAHENDLMERKAQESLKYDVFYEMICLACDSSHSLEAVLEPTCASVHPMDYHLIWHLWFVLRILGFQHLSKLAEHKIHIRYAEQLYQMELYHLAAFVLMHIPDLLSRNNALIDFADRIADVVDEETYVKLSTITRVPDYIIARSKYMRAKFEGDENKMCLYALQSGMLDEAHTLFFERVAPNMIISDEYDCLDQFADLFEEVSDRIPGWGPGGQVYIDFHQMKKKLGAVKEDDEMKEILDLAHSLELRLVAMSVNNPVQRLGASVMSHYVFQVIYGYEYKETENLPLSYEDTLEVATDLLLPITKEPPMSSPTISENNEQ